MEKPSVYVTRPLSEESLQLLKEMQGLELIIKSIDITNNYDWMTLKIPS